MGDRKFRAFISYSHADEEWGAWLQRSLERFRAPKALASALAASGRPVRLSPVFRDREDLPVAGDLNEAIKSALADSEYQIILCSPTSAKSRWVNEEIKLFHRLNGPGRVFALIVAGEPGASAIPGREEEECFPHALRFQLDERGEVTERLSEPLAADARRGADGKRYALLKVAAGMLGVGLDDLVRRDAARRTRIAWTMAGASGAGAAVFAFATVEAVSARNEARLMRGKAENLVEFMLTDLKERLEPVGRLDVLEAVGDEALAYYADQELKSLDDRALARRAKAMILLGNIDFKRNDVASAERAYGAAERTTKELVDRSPDNLDRIFEHAQAVFYVGEAAGAGGDMSKAEQQLVEYHRLAEQLLESDQSNPKWRLELAYATSNLGMLKLKRGDYEGAVANFKQSIDARRELRDGAPRDKALAEAHAYAISWRVVAEAARGDFRTAVDLIENQLAIYGADAGPDSENYRVLDAVLPAQRRLASAYIGLGDLDNARIAIARASDTADRLLAREKGNATWNVTAAHIERLKSYLFQLAGDHAASIASADRGVALAEAVAMRASGDEIHRIAFALALAHRISLGGDDSQLAGHALTLAATAADLAKSSSLERIGASARVALALARYEKSQAREESAEAVISAAMPDLEANADRIAAADRIALASLYLEAGAPAKAAPIVAALERLGVRHPDLLAARERIRELAAN